MPFGFVGGTTSSCEPNNVHAGAEACDNGPLPGCVETGVSGNATCTVEMRWRCRKGAPIDNSPSVCIPDCGDDFVFTAQGEACDDGGTANGDGCSATCAIEPGFTCTIVNNRSVCTPICGDGLQRGGEACDNGAQNSDERPDACRTDCTVARCGDGVEDAPELCDDGSWNGLPGLCATGCNDVSARAINPTNHALTAAPAGTFAIFLSDVAQPLCIDVEVGDFSARQNFIDNNGFFAGRPITLTEDRVVRHPVLLADEGRLDGEPMFSAMSSSAEVGSSSPPARQ